VVTEAGVDAKVSLALAGELGCAEGVEGVVTEAGVDASDFR